MQTAWEWKLRCQSVSCYDPVSTDSKIQNSLNSLPQVSQYYRIHTAETLPSKHPSLQFTSMSLHLIPMLIHTPKEVRTAMHIQHDSLPFISRLLPLFIVRSHLDPFCLQFAPWSAPLPPELSSNLLNAMMAQLLLYVLCAFRDVFLGDLDLVQLHPARVRNPLRGEALDFLDGVVGGIEEKLLNQMETFVVGDMRRGLLRKGFAI